MMNTLKGTYMPQLADVAAAASALKDIIVRTPLQYNARLSQQFEANIYLKREDLQAVRSYKIRGAYNKMRTLSRRELDKGIVCASAGNHAQGVAMSCKMLAVNGVIYMPVTTPKQKVDQVKMFGADQVTVVLRGDTFDEAKDAAITFSKSTGACFIHPFDDKKIIEGQATIALEILSDMPASVDYILLPVGGGGLAAGVSAVMKQSSPATKIIGVEPAGAASMSHSLKQKSNTTLTYIDKFVDGAAVKRVGELTYAICSHTLDNMLVADEGKICQSILELYNKDALVAEPAGALSVAALEQLADSIKGKNVVCMISGSNNDITRMEEIKERALLYSNLKHYFIIKFPQRPGALREFVNEVLGPDDDITHFEYTKKTSREKGTAVVGIELKTAEDFGRLNGHIKARGYYVNYLNDQPHLLSLLV